MSRTQKEKQQAFKQKLQSEGADSFADGPRPWEQWDESGNQNDNRVWEGTARRIYPKKKAARGFGDRLLSGLAVIALGSMMIGIAGVYFSTPSTPQQARSTIQPPPIVIASRTTAPPAARPTESADRATPVIAQLDTLAPPAAGIPAPPEKHQTILEPTATAERTTPVIQADSIDKVAVETVVTEGTVTTTVYTRQPSQEEPELVAMIATTAPPFTHADSPYEETPLTATTESTRPGQTGAPPIEPLVVAQTGAEESTAPAVVEQAAATVTEPAVIALAETEIAEPAVVEQPTETATEPAVVALAGTDVAEPAVVEQPTETATEPAVIALAGTEIAEPAVVEQPTETATEPAVVALAGTEVAEPAVVEQPTETATEPAVVALAGTEVAEPAVVEQPTETATEPAVDAQTGTIDTETAVTEETAKPTAAAGIVALNTPAAETGTAPDIGRELETATQTPVLPEAKTGKWVINLSSYTRKTTAERMLAVFRQKGVDAEVFSTTINDKPMHRIRVTGFESARSAKAEISTLEQQLGLEGIWVSKR
jgi:hypothetical protein